MKKIILKFSLKILNTIYKVFKLLKVKNKIVYISRQFDRPTLDFIMLKEEIEKQNPNYKQVFLCKRLEKGILSKISYVFHLFVQMYHISTAKIVVVDSYCITVSTLEHRKSLQVIQIWHSLGAIKKFGHQTIGKASGSSPDIAKIMKMHNNYNYIISQSEITSKHYMKAFKAKKENIKYMGLPKIDYILKKDEDMNKRIYDKYPIMKDKINLLYVPTFRKSKKIKLKQLISGVDTSKYNLIVKLHPLDQKDYTKYSDHKYDESIILDKEFDTYDLLKVSDMIITDYSSLSLDASLLNKPVFFYIYDIEDYRKDPGLNFDFLKEEIRYYATKKTKQLFKLIDEKYDFKILERFRKKYININTENCTEQLAKFVLELTDDENAKEG